VRQPYQSFCYRLGLKLTNAVPPANLANKTRMYFLFTFVVPFLAYLFIIYSPSCLFSFIYVFINMYLFTEKFYLLGYEAVFSIESQRSFRGTYHLHFDPENKATCSSEKSIDFQWTAGAFSKNIQYFIATFVTTSTPMYVYLHILCVFHDALTDPDRGVTRKDN
jgi:hypothetical protein